ncbi:hypothetical protein [Vibrio diabolicus]|uniref:hypothetical protein n=1 Tax=Vibrio diabolicus TaxID=50719 RepID=UPI00233110C7|nr:hypothetical protein [Vibrio diabolicus]
MSIKKLASILGVLLVSGCAQTMPDNVYDQYAVQLVHLQKCFENGSMSPKLYAQSKGAYGYALSTWSYDRERLIRAMNNYQYAEVTEQDCRMAEANAYATINNTQQRKYEEAANAKALSDSIQRANDQMNANKPVYCNTTGTSTVCY